MYIVRANPKAISYRVVIFPILSTGGAPYTSVFLSGSSKRGNFASRYCNRPRGGGEFRAVGGTEAAGDAFPIVVVLPGVPNTLCCPSSIVPTGFVPALCMALASSSTSSKTSCLTALSEYAHIPTANAPSAVPVMAFLTRYGSRARRRPGDIVYGSESEDVCF